MNIIASKIARVFSAMKSLRPNRWVRSWASSWDGTLISMSDVTHIYKSAKSAIFKVSKSGFGISFTISVFASVLFMSLILTKDNNIISSPTQTTKDTSEALSHQPNQAPTTIAAKAYETLMTPAAFKQRATLKKGEALVTLVKRLGINNSDAYKALHETRKLMDASSLKPGMPVIATYSGASNKHLDKLTIRDRFDREIEITKDGDTFKAVSHTIATTPLYDLAEGAINSSLYKATSDADVPSAILGQMIKLFSYDVDFERDIRKGAEYKVYYRQDLANQYQDIDNGSVLYASLKLHNRTVEITQYVDPKGGAHYYTPDGLSIKKALMKTPVDGARLTSSFGRRRHPVLGYTKMHKGLDFGASRGTPIMAAGDGTIERANRYGAYGNYIRIKHFDGLKTAYAHMKKFERGMRKGKRVKQGQVIGYVGTTGRSTGPHLHYEVLKNGKQTNPLRLKVPRGKALVAKEKPLLQGQMATAYFNMERIRETKNILKAIQLASNDQGGATAGK